MSETMTLRVMLTERGIPHTDIGIRDTRWESDGVVWTAHEGNDGGIWLKVAGPMRADEIARFVDGE